jgi:hypothetical protein
MTGLAADIIEFMNAAKTVSTIVREAKHAPETFQYKLKDLERCDNRAEAIREKYMSDPYSSILSSKTKTTVLEYLSFYDENASKLRQYLEGQQKRVSQKGLRSQFHKVKTVTLGKAKREDLEERASKGREELGVLRDLARS